MNENELYFQGKLSPLQFTQLDTFYQRLVEWNERMNLTGITERSEVFIKHFLDSLLVTELPEWQRIVSHSGHVIDIGTGAGFPGLPLAIRYPEVSFTLCDSLRKRLSFLDNVIQELGLKNVRLVHGRAEDLGRDVQYRQSFDGVVSRAVARLNILAELMCPFLRTGGIAFAYKGPQVQEELDDGKRSLKILGGVIRSMQEFTLPSEAGVRYIVAIEQLSRMSKQYPRKPGILQKQPL